MLPLKFPNNGIRTKVFMRKIDFKLRVMRLNHIESVYIFLLRFCIKHSEEGAVGQATYKGSWPWPDPLQGWPAMAKPLATKAPCKGAIECCQGQPIGAVAHRGSKPPTGMVDCGQPTGAAYYRAGDRPSARQLSAGKGSRRLRRGGRNGGVVR
ncbi:hypothetical protein B296_00036466, partial [Ensete ventricosum]